MFDLTGRTALVTGATGGIGGAIAQALHAQGATVAISGTRREVLDSFAAKLGERVHVLPCNLSDSAEVEALVPAAEAAMGQVDILIANAGITRDNLFVQLRDEDWDDVIQVNLTATFRLARAATKLMMRKRFGRIIAITSIVGVTGNPGQANYTASKAGHHRPDQDAGRGICQAQRDRQLHRAGLYQDADDRRAQRQAARDHPDEGSCGAAGDAGGHRRGGRLSRLQRGSLRHRSDDSRQRWNGHVLSGLSPRSMRPKAVSGAVEACSQGWGSMITEPPTDG